jgi:diguanylate cyclase (GGDEF)-like protein
LRRTDVFCRLGGEEFMVLCPDIDGDHAYSLATELWQGLRGAPVDRVGVVTASFGIASWRMGEGADALLLRADSGVYLAKQSGRDRIERVMN